MALQQSLLNELNIDPDLLEKAFETAKSSNESISDIINHALGSYMNKTVLEARGYKETTFHLPKNKEVKKLFVKQIGKYEIKHEPADHIHNPNFSGVVYPSTLIDVFITPKANIVVKKSIHGEVQFCKGQIIQEQASSRTIDLVIGSNLDSVRTKVPETLFHSLSAAYSQDDIAAVRSQLDDRFYHELEL